MEAKSGVKRGAIEWSRIREEYISGSISYGKLAQKYGCSQKMVALMGKRENWRQQRSEYRAGLLKQTMDRVQAAEAEQAAERLLALRSAADRMTDVINRVFDDSEQFYRYMVRQDGETTCETYDKVDTRAIRDLTVSIKDLAGVLRDLYDLPTVQERQAMELAREKMDMARADNDGAAEGMVVEFEGAANDWAG